MFCCGGELNSDKWFDGARVPWARTDVQCPAVVAVTSPDVSRPTPDPDNSERFFCNIYPTESYLDTSHILTHQIGKILFPARAGDAQCFNISQIEDALDTPHTLDVTCEVTARAVFTIVSASLPGPWTIKMAPRRIGIMSPPTHGGEEQGDVSRSFVETSEASHPVSFQIEMLGILPVSLVKIVLQLLLSHHPFEISR